MEAEKSPRAEASLARMHAYQKLSGLRQTSERDMICRAAYDFDTPFTAEALLARVVPGFHVSRATVYSTLELMRGSGLLQAVGDASAPQREFYFTDRPMAMVKCRECGRRRWLTSEEAANLVASKKLRGYEVESWSIVLSGICTSCKRRRNAKLKNIASV